jgi:hypothetical protein
MLVRICWAGTALVSGFSLLTLASDLSRAESAPQQAAAAAMAVAWVVIPYVFTRSVEGLFPLKENASPKATPKSAVADLAAGQY